MTLIPKIEKARRRKKDDRWLPLVKNIEYDHEQGYFVNEKPISHRMTEVISWPNKNDHFNKVRRGDYGEERRVDLLISLHQGNVAHACLDAFHRGRSCDPECYEDLVKHLLSYWIWDEWEAIASEYMMFDPRKNIAGTCDMVLRHKEDHSRIAVADLKTKKDKRDKNGKPIIHFSDHRAQVGGYIHLLNLTWPKLMVEDCFVIYASPSMCDIDTYNYVDCLTEFQAISEGYFRDYEGF